MLRGRLLAAALVLTLLVGYGVGSWQAKRTSTAQTLKLSIDSLTVAQLQLGTLLTYDPLEGANLSGPLQDLDRAQVLVRLAGMTDGNAVLRDADPQLLEAQWPLQAIVINPHQVTPAERTKLQNALGLMKAALKSLDHKQR